ncbi:MAG: cytochrome c [Polyangiaceae bacterium]|nr:cytochrome c [Polyangiaceae bacterium]
MHIVLVAAGATAVALGVACGSQQSSPPVAGAEPKLDTAELKHGEALFMRNCNQCHPGGAGGLGPALNNKPAPKGAIALVIRTGPGQMPRFSHDDLSADDVDAITDYVVALRNAKSDAEEMAAAK